MITAQQSRTVESTLGGETVQMGVQIENMPHIMGMLINQYPEPEYASLREYSTNAYDAHVEAGVTRPIEVSLPSRLSPFLRIKDYGVGMDADAIRQVYSQYGSSTKRSSNDFNGMFGIGGKAALSYTDQFTVVSTKNGKTIQVSVSRAANGGGVMQIVSEKATSKPNGTEVLIPAKVPNDFGKWAAHMFRFWKPGTVHVDGREPVRDEPMKLTDDIWLIDGSQSYIVMGNVPYKASIRHELPTGYDYASRSYRPERAVACFVPIGAVEIPPSREEVTSTARSTRETVRALEGTIGSAKVGAVQRQIDEAATPHEAVMALLKWIEALGLAISDNHYTWNGDALPGSYEPETEFKVTGSNGTHIGTKMLLSDNSTKKLSKADRRQALPVSMWEGTLIAYGYDRKGMTATQKRKLIKYVADNNLVGVKRFALVAFKPPAAIAKWIGSGHIIPWADVHAIKLPTTSVASGYTGRLPGSYDVFDAGSFKYGVAGDQIDRTRPIFYVHGNYHDTRVFEPLLTKHHPNCYIFPLGANRIDKFRRILPAAKHCREGIKELWQQEAKRFSAEERLALHIADEGLCLPLQALDPARLDDPALREAHRLAKIAITDLTNKRAAFARLVDTYDPDAVEWDNPLENYPLYKSLWKSCGSYYAEKLCTSDDMYFYLNTKFAAASATTKKGA